MNTNFIFYRSSGLLHDIQYNDIFSEEIVDRPLDPGTGTNYENLNDYEILDIKDILGSDDALKSLSKDYPEELIKAILEM